MAKISLREAVKHFDVSRPTLHKALKNGKVSGQQDEHGHWLIDPSELARVYNPRGSQETPPAISPQDSSSFDQPIGGQELPPNTELVELKTKLIEAEKRAELAEALARERAQHIEDLRRMLPAPSKPGRKWWPWRS